MKQIDNKDLTLRDDLLTVIKDSSKVAIAASCYSIFVFQELKDSLKDIDELRFIFTSPTFTTDKVDKQRREYYYIPRLKREHTVYGSELISNFAMGSHIVLMPICVRTGSGASWSYMNTL